MARVDPVLPKFLVKNISSSDVLLLNHLPIRPGQTVDLYKTAEYQSDRIDLTNSILRGLEMPDGDIYVKWKIKRKIEILEFNNPIFQGNGINASKLQSSNEYYNGAVLSIVDGKLRWIDSPAGAATADYLLLAPDSGLPNSRVMIGETGQINLDDDGPGTAVTVGLVDTAVTAGTYGSKFEIPRFTVDSKGRVTSASNIVVDPPGQSVNSIRKIYADSAVDPETDYTILVDASAGPVTVTLPVADGLFFNIKKVDSTINAVNLVSSASVIDGESVQQIIKQWECLSVQSLDGDWYIV